MGVQQTSRCVPRAAPNLLLTSCRRVGGQDRHPVNGDGDGGGARHGVVWRDKMNKKSRRQRTDKRLRATRSLRPHFFFPFLHAVL